MIELPIWECLYRIQTLNRFIARLDDYNKHSKNYYRRRGTSASDETGSVTRKSINLMIPKVARFLLDVGIYPMIDYRDPPAIGGRTIHNIDLLNNLFNLSDFEVPIQMVEDAVQKAIGCYQDDLFKSFIRTINPFWWLWQLVLKIIRIPFEIINWAGFDSDKAETSSGGKLYKAIAGLSIFIAGLVTFLASIVQILDSFGMIQSVKDFFQSLGN